MPQSGSIAISLVILVVLILTNAYFAMSEIAILSANQNRIKKLAESGDKRAKQLMTITSSSSGFLATIQVGVTLSGLLASAVAAERFVGILVEKLSFIPIPVSVMSAIALVVITIILAYFQLIFGELVPKRIAMKFPDKIALSVAGPLSVLYKILKPFISFLAASTNLFARLFGIKGDENDEPVTQEDILMVAEQGEETGSIHDSELKMIHNIFELDDKIVSEIMRHRTEMVMVEDTARPQEVIALSKEKGYSRIPVYKEDIDNIIGIVHVKDLLGNQRNKTLRSYIRKPLYVPEGKPCSQLLLDFQAKRTHMAIVIDEYGGTAGLVTLEDLLEIIVGSIQDESDNETPEIEKIDDNTYLFDGGIDVEQVEEILGTNLTDEFDGETLAGYLTYLLGFIPTEAEKDEIVLSDEYKAYVCRMEDKRISQVRIVKAPAVIEEEEAEGK